MSVLPFAPIIGSGQQSHNSPGLTGKLAFTEDDISFENGGSNFESSQLDYGAPELLTQERGAEPRSEFSKHL